MVYYRNFTLPIQVPNVQLCISIQQVSTAVNYGICFAMISVSC